MQSPPTDTADAKTAFRKPSNDAANRKYRRRSPVSGSSSSSGSPKHENSFSPHSREDFARASDHMRGRRELERDPGRSQYSRSSSDSHRYSDRQSSRYSHSHNRHDDYNRHEDKYADEEERHHQKLSSRYVRESKGGTYSDQTRHETAYNRSRDKYSHRRNDADREDSYLEHQKQRDKESFYNRDGSGRRHAKELDGRKRDKEEKNIGDRECIKEKNRHGRETGEQFEGKTVRIGENQESTAKRPKMFSFDNTEYGNDGPESKTTAAEEKPTSSLKQLPDVACKVASEQSKFSVNDSEAANDLNAAKVAAMKAAELVNRNLTGTGCMSADQKKKLLWGNKKNTTAEESGHRWDTALFSDRERQEKFNKLMGVKGDVKMEQKPEKQNGSDALQAEKLQLDLEKQYTAGLRRRDGRTVGLGL